MAGNDLGESIEGFIRHAVENASTVTRYRRPLVGFASVDDTSWSLLRQIAEPTHCMPHELLEGARTVIAYFLPFSEEIVRANRHTSGTAREWAVAYAETNTLLNGIARNLIEALGKQGIRGAAQPATLNWDPETLVSRWSHKSVAAIAGLGTFGLHRMLITDAGCAGRCGSVVIDAVVPPTPRRNIERCLHFAGGECIYCVSHCPVSALEVARPGQRNLDKQSCWAQCQRVGQLLGSDCCGKCAMGPCALGSAV